MAPLSFRTVKKSPRPFMMFPIIPKILVPVAYASPNTDSNPNSSR